MSARVDGGRRGTVLDLVRIAYPPENLKHLGAYTSVLVALEGGGRVFGIVDGDAARVSAGQQVIATGAREGGCGPFFDPVPSSRER